jgi:AraC-like DNA-binding protein
MSHQPVEDFLSTLQVELSAFAVCEIARDWRLCVAPLPTIVCHFVLSGRGFVEVEGERTLIEPGAIIVVPPGTAKSIAGEGEIRHQAAADQSCVLHSDGLLAFQARDGDADLVLGCASLSATYAGQYGLFEYLEKVITVNVASEHSARMALETLLQELSQPKVGSTAMAECLMKQLLILLLRSHLHEIVTVSPGLSALSDPRLLRAVNAVISHPEDAHSVSSLAALVGMSRSSFAARFADRFEQTPMQFVQSVRMRSAARLLLASDVPIKCLASAVGYSSRSQFSRAFRDTYGADPSSYRSRNGRGAEDGANLEAVAPLVA